MDTSFSMGGLIPLWILGAPFLAALVSLAFMPKRRADLEQHDRSAPAPAMRPMGSTAMAGSRM